MAVDEKCDNCKPSIQLATITERLNKLEAETKESLSRQGARIGDIETLMGRYEERTDNMLGSTKEIKDNMVTTTNEIKELIKDLSKQLKDLETKPARNYDEIVKVIIGVVVTAAVTYFIYKK